MLFTCKCPLERNNLITLWPAWESNFLTWGDKKTPLWKCTGGYKFKKSLPESQYVSTPSIVFFHYCSMWQTHVQLICRHHFSKNILHHTHYTLLCKLHIIRTFLVPKKLMANLSSSLERWVIFHRFKWLQKEYFFGRLELVLGQINSKQYRVYIYGKKFRKKMYLLFSKLFLFFIDWPSSNKPVPPLLLTLIPDQWQVLFFQVFYVYL